LLGPLPSAAANANKQSLFRSRKTSDKRRKKRHRQGASSDLKSPHYCNASPCCGTACVRSKSTLHCMNCLAKMLLWMTFVSLAAAVVWYSYELFNHGYVCDVTNCFFALIFRKLNEFLIDFSQHRPSFNCLVFGWGLCSHGISN
jgi:hypothetical protein